MKSSFNFLSILINSLLGASWAISFLGGTYLAFIFSSLGIFYILFAFLIGMLPGAFFVLLIEYFLLHQEKLDELKRQTQLLEELLKKN